MRLAALESGMLRAPEPLLPDAVLAPPPIAEEAAGFDPASTTVFGRSMPAKVSG